MVLQEFSSPHRTMSMSQSGISVTPVAVAWNGSSIVTLTTRDAFGNPLSGSGRTVVLCAEHVWSLGGASPPPNLMEVKGKRLARAVPRGVV